MSVTYYKGFVGKEDVEFGTGTFTRKDKNHASRDLTQINASHIPFNSQSKYIDDLVDEGYDVDIFPRISIPKNVLSTMTGHETFSPTDGQVFWKDPGGASRNFNPSGTFDAAHIIYLINTADASENITFDSAGLAQVVGQGQAGIFIYNGTDWDLINIYTSPETNIEIQVGITSDHGFSGIFSSETVGENVVFGNTLYLKSDGKLWKADADDETTLPVVAIALASISADSTGNVLKSGYIRDDSWTWTVGGLIYASGTAGALTQTKPLLNQKVGYAYSADIIYFNPEFSLGDKPGEVKTFTTSTVPDGWLECDGSAISRTTYAALFAIISDDYGPGDASTTFNIPDYRGRFLRSWAHGSANDPDRATRTDRGDGTGGDVVGSKQDDYIEAHSHSYNAALSTTASTSGSSNYDVNQTAGYTTGATGGNETRPTNTNVMYCIRY